MTPTAAYRELLRDLLNEGVPAGGSVDDTRFQDAQLDVLLEGAHTINGAASDGWMRKAGMFLGELGGVERDQIGQESYTYTSLRDMLAYAREMADHYRQLDAAERGVQIGRMLSVERLEVC